MFVFKMSMMSMQSLVHLVNKPIIILGIAKDNKLEIIDNFHLFFPFFNKIYRKGNLSNIPLSAELSCGEYTLFFR